MRFSIITTLSASPLFALVHAVPAPEAAAVGSTFTLPGTYEEGFQVPLGLSPGGYRVSFDDKGLAHYTKVSDISTNVPVPGNALGSSAAGPKRSAEEVSAVYIGETCPGYEMNHDEINWCVEQLAAMCGRNGLRIPSYERMFS